MVNMNNLLFLVFAGILGSTTTFYVSAKYKISSVRSSALLSTLVGLFFYSFPELFNAYVTKNIPLVFLGTSFIGMVSSISFGSYFRLATAGILFSIIYSFKSHFFEGFGGALGALAFISFLTSISITILLSRKYKMKKIFVGFKKIFKFL